MRDLGASASDHFLKISKAKLFGPLSRAGKHRPDRFKNGCSFPTKFEPPRSVFGNNDQVRFRNGDVCPNQFEDVLRQLIDSRSYRNWY